MTREEILDALLREFLAESWTTSHQPILRSAESKRHLLRTLMNVRPPLPVSSDLVELQDRLLSAEREAKGVTAPRQLPTIREVFGGGDVPFSDRLVLWKGDITTLAADAIVNAANPTLLGCFVPHHRCIDNAIHSAAGIQLRLECNDLMQRQGFDEPLGQAKLTHGYNLPAPYVIHTVGPTIHGEVHPEDERILESCYTSCLDLALQYRDTDRIEAAGRWLAGADFILIGAGAGLSAAAGLNYQDPALFRKWYPGFAGLGLNTIWEAIVAHWDPDDMNRRRFWAFWAYHIQKIRHDAPSGTAYLNLARLLLGKPYFVITTNVDAMIAGNNAFGGLVTRLSAYSRRKASLPK